MRFDPQIILAICAQRMANVIAKCSGPENVGCFHQKCAQQRVEAKHIYRRFYMTLTGQDPNTAFKTFTWERWRRVATAHRALISNNAHHVLVNTSWDTFTKRYQEVQSLASVETLLSALGRKFPELRQRELTQTKTAQMISDHLLFHS